MISVSTHCSSFHFLDAFITWDHYFICCISYPCRCHIIFYFSWDPVRYLPCLGPHNGHKLKPCCFVAKHILYPLSYLSTSSLRTFSAQCFTYFHNISFLKIYFIMHMCLHGIVWYVHIRTISATIRRGPQTPWSWRAWLLGYWEVNFCPLK